MPESAGVWLSHDTGSTGGGQELGAGTSVMGSACSRTVGLLQASIFRGARTDQSATSPSAPRDTSPICFFSLLSGAVPWKGLLKVLGCISMWPRPHWQFEILLAPATDAGIRQISNPYLRACRFRASRGVETFSAEGGK